MSKTIKNEISIRQICAIFIALTPVNKILTLPSILAGYTQNQLYIPLIISFAIDMLILFLILKLGERFKNQTFFDILTSSFGKTTAKVIFFILGLHFFLKSFLPIVEQKHFIDNTLYEVFPNFISFFPLLILSAYACVKGLKVLGRCADISLWLTGVSILLIICFSITSSDLSNILPINKMPTYNTINACFTTIIWFTESLYMFLFLGHFKSEKKQNVKIMVSFLIASIIVLAIAVIFYGVFGDISKTQIFAVSDMTIYTTKIINVGRFDYLAIFLLLFSKIFSICMPVYMATKCFEYAFGLKKALIPALIINGALLLSIIILEDKLYAILAFSKSYVNWFFLFTAYILPIILFIFARGKQNGKA